MWNLISNMHCILADLGLSCGIWQVNSFVLFLSFILGGSLWPLTGQGRIYVHCMHIILTVPPQPYHNGCAWTDVDRDRDDQKCQKVWYSPVLAGSSAWLAVLAHLKTTLGQSCSPLYDCGQSRWVTLESSAQQV
jgi:hypothetical protein